MTLRGTSLLLGLALSLLAPLPTIAAPPGSKAVEQAMNAGERDDVIDALRRAFDGASSKEAPWIALHLGEQLRLNGDSKEARKVFKQLAREGGDIGAGAELGMALAELAEGKDSMQVLREISEKAALDTQNADRYAMLARDARRQGQDAASASLTKKALRYASADPGVLARLERALTGPEDERAAGPTDESDMARLDRAVAAGDASRVATLADKLRASSEPDTDARAVADYAARRVGLTADPNTIAVLLPMSGKYRGVGAQLKKALQMGWGMGGGGRHLVFLDTGEDASSAKAAMEKAVFELRAVAVVGPLRSELAAPVARIAQATRTPLLGLHQDSTASDDRPWVMDGISTPEAQVEGLVEHVMSTEDMKAFAIFAPDNAYGRAAADAFESAVAARGGTIAVREHYDTEATDLIPFAKKLGRKDYEARAAEWREVRRTIEEAGGDPSRAVLPPVLDFDAIFLPDNWRRIPVAAAGLAYEEFPVGDFRITKDGPVVPLLGLSGWNHPQLVTSGGPYVRAGRFVDVFLPDDASVAEFVQTYRQENGKDPNTLEAQTWSVGRLLRAAAPDESQDRAGFRAALLQASIPDATATGATGMDADRRWLAHRIRVLTLDKEGIHEVRSPQPDAPE